MTATSPDRLDHQQIYINLAVEDLTVQQNFYAALGWKLNEMFSDENAASFEISDHIVLMLLKTEFFNTFHDRSTVGPHGPREVLNAVGADSPAEVDELIRRARAAGAEITREPESQGPMYGAAFDDPEGHGWEVMHMDPATFE